MTTGHLVQECGEAIAAALDKADAVELLYLSPADKASAMREFARLSARVDATRLRLMAVADEVTEEKGDRDVAAWCQRELLVDRGAARRDMTLAGALEHRWTVLAQAHRSGEVSTAQADVIARALDDLPDEHAGRCGRDRGEDVGGVCGDVRAEGAPPAGQPDPRHRRPGGRGGAGTQEARG